MVRVDLVSVMTSCLSFIGNVYIIFTPCDRAKEHRDGHRRHINQEEFDSKRFIWHKRRPRPNLRGPARQRLTGSGLAPKGAETKPVRGRVELVLDESQKRR